MKRIQGINKYRRGQYVELKFWLGPKRNLDGSTNTPYRKLFGRWTLVNILRAQEHMERVKKDFAAGKLPKPDPRPILFSQACDLYYKSHWDRPERSQKAKINCRSRLKKFKSYWSTKALDAFKPKDILEYRGAREKEGAGLGTINREHAALSSLFEFMDGSVKREEIDPFRLPDFNPCRYVRKPNVDHLKRERYATREELEKVKQWCSEHDPELWLLIARAIVSGLRFGDLKAAQGQSRVKLVQQKTKRQIIQPLDFSKPYTFNRFWKRWTTLRRSVGMLDFHWHDWRHTSATMLKLIGAADEVIQEVLGHSDIEQTRAYINGKEERLRPWMEKLNRELEAI